MNTKLFQMALILVFSWGPSQAGPASEFNYGLDEYKYNELILLKIESGHVKKMRACFYGTHDLSTVGTYRWLHLGDRIGVEQGQISSFEKNRLQITQTIAPNGDWLDVQFYWPVAKSVLITRLAGGCQAATENP